MYTDDSKITRLNPANQSQIDTAVALLRETHELLTYDAYIPDPRPLKLRMATDRFLRGFSNTPEAA